jgi:hypothetical protein
VALGGVWGSLIDEGNEGNEGNKDNTAHDTNIVKEMQLGRLSYQIPAPRREFLIGIGRTESMLAERHFLTLPRSLNVQIQP